MSLDLFNVILHQLHKNDADELVVNYRSQSLENNASTASLVGELHRVFNSKPAKGFGTFKSDSEFSHWLHELSDGKLNFYEFSQKSAEKLKEELIKYPFAEEGILVMAEYQSLATEYLFIGILSTSQSLKVTEGLDISATDYLDIRQMDIAARLDLSAYRTDADSNRYLSYIKGRVGGRLLTFSLIFCKPMLVWIPSNKIWSSCRLWKIFVLMQNLRKMKLFSIKTGLRLL